MLSVSTSLGLARPHIVAELSQDSLVAGAHSTAGVLGLLPDLQTAAEALAPYLSQTLYVRKYAPWLNTTVIYSTSQSFVIKAQRQRACG